MKPAPKTILAILVAFLAATALAALPLSGVEAQSPISKPASAPAVVRALPPAQDTPYPGVIKLEVDATDTARKIFRIRQTIPVQRAGPMVLLYPQWIPGNHAPRGPIYNYAGLTITANGKPVTWKRDPGDVYAFRVDVPAGAKALDISAQFLTPLEAAQGPTMVTAELLRLNWYVATLYPAGYYARSISVDASVKLPKGWSYATALETLKAQNDTIQFKTATLETVLDSPLFAGAHAKTWELQQPGQSPVRLNAFADDPSMLEPSEEALQAHRNLVVQADKLFGARQFDHYDFLLSISDRLATAGTEHSRSSDNGVRSGYFKSWSSDLISRDLLPHEYAHSWNGKYRRPEDLWRPHYNTPMGDSLLWLYEGQTQYWGVVLAARAGFLTKEQALDSLASTAAAFDSRVGRNWRPLADTTMDPIIAARRSLPWRSWQRSEDYYSEGLLIWLDVDTRIRELTDGKSSLDDFARTFLAGRDGDWGTVTYARKDVITALNSIAKNDWDAFFRARVDEVAKAAPLDGLTRGGYKLVYASTPGESWKKAESRGRVADHTYSIGLSVNDQGRILSVQWDSPAFRTGITTEAKVEGVNGKGFSLDRLNEAVAGTAKNTPVELLLRVEDTLKSVRIDYSGGAKYPRLERLGGEAPARLDAILAAR